MPSPANNAELLDLITRSGVADDKRILAYLEQLRARGQTPAEPVRFAEMLIAEGLLTRFQAEQLLQGKWKRFNIGKYKVLERLGSGGMGSVYLCEHTLMRRRVAVKVLPSAKAEDPAALERFYREARAVAALDHPNIVRAYDIDQDEKLHFLVMEHVDGASLQEIIKRSGPLAVVRACHYMKQSALGLQHAHEYAGIVHRDIKPANILVDRNGIVKILDMGLARFFHDEDDILTRKYDENVLGTADYLAPEQALDSHTVDIRADIYSLGATFYFTLTGKPPFAEGTVAQKLMWHQTRQPKSIRLTRPEVPEAVCAIIEKMMAKDPAQRFQSPIELAEALAPWTQTPIDPPPEREMPQLSRAAMTVDASPTRMGPATVGLPSPTPRRQWQVSTGSTPGREQTSPNTTPQPLPQPQSQPQTTPVPVPVTPAMQQPQRRPLSQPQPQRPAVVAPTPAVPVTPQPVAPAARRVPTAAATATATPATVAAAQVAEEEPAWEEMADNEGKGAASRPRRRHQIAPAIGARLWLWIGLGALLLVGILGATLYAVFSSGPRTQSAAAPREIIVDLKGTDGTTERSVFAAWRAARSGDRIVLRSGTEEVIALLGPNRKNITIEAEPGREVVWKAPATFPGNPSRKTLLRLEDLDGVVFRGITFDGDKADVLVWLFGYCPGVKFERCSFVNFHKAAIWVSNAEGDKARPIEFANCTFQTPDKSGAAMYFNILTNPGWRSKNRYILLKDLQGSDVRLRTPSAEFNDDITLPPGYAIAVVK